MLRLARFSCSNFNIRRKTSNLVKWNTKPSFKVKSYYSTIKPQHKAIEMVQNIKGQLPFFKIDWKNAPAEGVFVQLAKAVYESDVETVLAKIGSINKNDRDPYQNTLLYWAVAGENGETMAKLLLESGFDVDAKNSTGSTAFMLAAAMNYVNCMKILLDYGADLNALDSQGNSAIQYACLFDAPDAIKFLLENGIKFNRIAGPADSKAKISPLYSSAVCKILLESGARVDWCMSLPDDFSHIIAAPAEEVKMSLEAIIHFVKSDGTNYTLEEILEKPDTRGLTILSCAAEAGKAETVKVLLDMGAKVNPLQIPTADQKQEYLLSPLHCAAIQKHPKCVELLLKAGAQAATYTGNLEAVKQLEKLGAKSDVLFSHPKVGYLDLFCLAVMSGHEDTIKYFWKENKTDPSLLAYAFCSLMQKNEISKIEKLVEMGMDISQIRHPDVKPLYIAAANNNVRVIELLAQAGANINEFSAHDHTPLITAVTHGALGAVQCLIKLNVNINGTDCIGFSALGHAPTLEIMQILYDAGADVNNKGGIPPLAYFASMNKLEFIQKILDLGADIDANGLIGTPIMAAASKGNLPLVRFFMARGANPSGTIGIDELQVTAEQLAVFNHMKFDWHLKHIGITILAISAAGSGIGTLELVEECFKYETEKSGKLELGPLLVHTALNGVAPFVEKLLQLGAPVDTTLNDTSALHMAASNNKVEVVKLLLQAGANRDLKTKNGTTALDIAKSKNFQEIAELLAKK